MISLTSKPADLPVSRGPKRQWAAIPQFPELQPFERHVAMLLVQDAARPMIASYFDVTLETISTAVWRLYRKLDIVGLAGLTRLAIKRGYIEP